MGEFHTRNVPPNPQRVPKGHGRKPPAPKVSTKGHSRKPPPPPPHSSRKSQGKSSASATGPVKAFAYAFAGLPFMLALVVIFALAKGYGAF